MFELSYKLTDKDYIDFNEYHLFNSTSGKKSLWLIRCIFPAVSLVFILYHLATGYDPLTLIIEVGLFAIISVIFFLLSKKLLLISLKQNIKRLRKDGKLPYIPEAKLTFGDEQVVDEGPKTSTTIKYSMLERFCETETFFYIYFSSAQALIIPKSAFSDGDEIEHFVGFIKEKIAKPTPTVSE